MLASLSTTLILVNIILGFIIVFLTILLVAAILIVKSMSSPSFIDDDETDFIFGFCPEDEFEKN